MLGRCARAGVPVAAALLVANLAYQHPCVIITGDSMRPALQPGDVCMVRRGASVAPGDAVLIRADWCGALVHRVVRVADARSVYTKGDASLSEDMRPVSRDEIVGPVVSVMPLGRLRARWHGVVAGDTLRNQSHSTSALTERRVPHYTALQGGLPWRLEEARVVTGSVHFTSRELKGCYRGLVGEPDPPVSGQCGRKTAGA